jgi:type 1 fimbria pilin
VATPCCRDGWHGVFRRHAGRCERRHERHPFRLNFKLRVEECKEPVGQIARFTFGNVSDADPDVSALFRMLGSSPTHVGLEIANEKKRTIEPGKPYEANALATGDDFNFHVRLRETLYSVGGGAFTRPVTVRVDFR